MYYKRKSSDKYKGPETVAEWESNQILVKHGGCYIRVAYKCSLQMVDK